MCPASVIAIDGPAGSGKSTLGLLLAQRLGYLYFDTGVLYRALTWLALRRDVDPCDEASLAQLATSMDLNLLPATRNDGRACTVQVEGEDVTWALREPEVDGNVSLVSAHPRVRQALLETQRSIATRGRVVIVGRDIGTVVAPRAELKIFLRAPLDVRAERRLRDLRARGHTDVTLDQVRADLIERDRIDAGRAAAPLAQAADAVVIDNDGLSISEAVDQIERLARAVARQ